MRRIELLQTRRCFVGMILSVPFVPLLVSTATPVNAATAAEIYVHKVANHALLVARQGGTEAAFTSLVRHYAATTSIANFALGQYRPQLPSSQRGQYRTLMVAYIARLLNQYKSSLAGERFTVTGSDGTVVRGNIERTNGRIPVQWRLIKSGGGYRVSDVNVQGIWLAQYLRTSFTGILRRSNGNFAALFDHLKTGR